MKSTHAFPKNHGFTIIELLIATAVFSTVLLLCTTAMIQIGRVYFKGVTTTQTQEVVRAVIDDISRNIQFNGGAVIGTTSGSPQRFCVGNKRYSYVLGSKLDAAVQPHVLVVDNSATCASDAPQNLGAAGSLSPTSRELLSPNMRLHNLSVVDGGNGLYGVSVHIIYGDADLFDPITGQCTGGAGGQFCAVSALSTVVKKRVE